LRAPWQEFDAGQSFEALFRARCLHGLKARRKQ
jgi:hypothetical protein